MALFESSPILNWIRGRRSPSDARPTIGTGALERFANCVDCGATGDVPCLSSHCRMDCVHCSGLQRRACATCAGAGIVIKRSA